MLGECRCPRWMEWRGAHGKQEMSESQEKAGPRSRWVCTISWGVRANGSYMNQAAMDQIWISVRLLTSLEWIPKPRRER